MREHSPHWTVLRTLLVGALALTALLSLGLHRASAYETIYTYVNRWPVIGSANYSPLFRPDGIAVGPGTGGSIYVVDSSHARVQSYSKTGVFRGTYGTTDDGGRLTYDSDLGSGPHGICVDDYGYIYVADTAAHRVVMYDSSGNFVRSFGVYGSRWDEYGDPNPDYQPGQLDYPWGVAVDGQGRVYVCDYYNNNVSVFDLLDTTHPNQCVAVWGYDEPALGGPCGLAFAADGSLWVADSSTNRAVKYAVDYGTMTATYAAEISDHPENNDLSLLVSPYDVAIDSSGIIFVTDTYHSRILTFDPTTFQQATQPLGGNQGSAPGQMDHPEGAKLDSNDVVYISDTVNNRVLKYGQQWANDSDPPITTSNIPLDVWVRGPFDVSLAAADAQSGVGETWYGIDNISPTTLYTEPFSISAEGTTMVTFQSVDQKTPTPNVEPVKTQFLQIDNSAPHTTADAPSGWVTSPTDVSLIAADTLSGVAATEYSLGGSIVTSYNGPIHIPAEASSTLNFWSVDNVGNREDTQTVSLRMDSHAPVSSSDASTEIYPQRAIVTIAATDAVSGVAAIYYSIDPSSAPVPYTGPLTISAEGSTTLQYFRTRQRGQRRVDSHTGRLGQWRTPPHDVRHRLDMAQP